MKTLVCRGRQTLTPGEQAAVAAAVAAGGVVLFPTETRYGLGADPFSAAGVEKVYRVKGRPPGKPLPVLLEHAGLLDRLAATVPGPWVRLIRRFWPGPLTLLFPALPGLPPGIRSAEGQVALRVPGSPLCRAVLAAAGGCLTGTSANTSGAGSTGDPGEAVRDLGALLDLVVDAGTLPPSPESTLLMMDRRGEVVILREGVIGTAAVREALKGGAPGGARS
jgi:L-threonylcarbamoyladenylate synthase